MNFKKTIDNIEIYYECYILGIYRERITNVYPSKKENAFVYMDDKDVMHSIPYKWYNRYDDVKGKAIFINAMNLPLFITISKENLHNYCAPKPAIHVKLAMKNTVYESDDSDDEICDTCGEYYSDCISCECPDDCKCLKLCEQDNGGRCPHYPYDSDDE